MRVIAAIPADLEVTPIGTRSRLADELRGIPVLRRTVDRLRRAPSIEGVFVLCPSPQAPRCERILEGSGARVCGHDAGPPLWGSLVRAARKWSLDGWRGGIGGTTVFDEYCDGRLLEGLLKTHPADAVMVVPAAAVVVDPNLTEGLIHRRRTVNADIRLTFTPVPPGVAGILLDAALVLELAEKNIPLGWLFSYQPDSPRKDLLFEECCMEAPMSLRFAVGRLLADTERSMRRLADLLSEHADPNGEEMGVWLSRREATHLEPLPREVEIELTTDDPYPHSVLHPRGSRVPRREPLDVATAGRLAGELVSLDDSLVVLGGFGDPLRHPEFEAILRALRPGNGPQVDIYGIGVRTRAVDLTDEVISALIECRVDVLNVILDAWTPELYGRLASPDAPISADLPAVLARIDRVAQLRERHCTATPIVVPEFTKSRLNVQEMDDFHDGWLRRAGAVCVTGASNRAGQFDDQAVMNMAPSPREPCRRIGSRCFVLSDGRSAACDQDFRGLHTVGSLQEVSLGEIWRGPALSTLRNAQRTRRFDVTPICKACNEWHRP